MGEKADVGARLPASCRQHVGFAPIPAQSGQPGNVQSSPGVCSVEPVARWVRHRHEGWVNWRIDGLMDYGGCGVVERITPVHAAFANRNQLAKEE